MSAIAVVDDRVAWTRQPGESPKAFSYFAMYRDLLADRSLTNVARILHESPSEKRTVESVRAGLAPLSSAHSWVARAEAYDIELDRRHREARESELDRERRQTAGTGAALLSLGLRRLRGAPPEGDRAAVAAIDPNDLDATDVVRLITEGTKLRRLGLGLPTDLSRAALTITPSDHQRAVGLVVEIALGRIPREEHARFLEDVRSAFERR